MFFIGKLRAFAILTFPSAAGRVGVLSYETIRLYRIAVNQACAMRRLLAAGGPA
jgi:hypothetical protein